MMTFNREKYKQFNNQYLEALVEKQKEFIFEEYPFNMDYAAYLLQYLDHQFNPTS